MAFLREYSFLRTFTCLFWEFHEQYYVAKCYKILKKATLIECSAPFLGEFESFVQLLVFSSEKVNQYKDDENDGREREEYNQGPD